MFKNFLKDETGLELSEYAVAAALVALAAVAAFQLLGGNISHQDQRIGRQAQISSRSSVDPAWNLLPVEGRLKPSIP